MTAESIGGPVHRLEDPGSREPGGFDITWVSER